MKYDEGRMTPMTGLGTMRWVFGMLVAGLAVGGCKVGPDYQPPRVPVPPSWGEPATRPAGSVPATQPTVVRWWKTFNDPVLDTLIELAVESNLDLKIAAARVREARALRRVVAADRWPSVNSSATYQRSKGSENVSFGGIGGSGQSSVPGVGAGATPFDVSGFFGERDLWQVGFDATWELDIFGGIKRSIEAADADVQATQDGMRDVLVSLLAEVAANYVDLRGLQRQIAIAKQNVKAQQETVELTRARFQAGLTGELDVVRAESQVAVTAAALPRLETAARQAINRIGVLTGRWPGALATELLKESPIPAATPVVPVGLPSELLRRRPDIRRAERQLAAATARIGVATADLFPKFSLVGGLGLRSDRAKDLFEANSGFWSIGPGVTLPLFDRGRIRANIEAHNARTEQALAGYESAVLRALQEVEDALVAYEQEQARRKLLADAVKANRRAMELANELYARGLVDFLTVLEAQRSLFLTEEQLAGTESATVRALVGLYKALGGGWEEGLADRPRGPQ